MLRRVLAVCAASGLFFGLASAGCGGDGTDDTTSTGQGGSASTGTGSGGSSTSTGQGGNGGGGGMMPPPQPSACQDTTDAIVAATGNTITVSPAGDGEVTVDGNTTTLRSVLQGVQDGDTVLLEDGTYTLPEAGNGYSGIYITTPNVTLRSASGNASAVIIDTAYRLHGGQTATITVDAPGVVLANFTVRRSVFHLIHLWENGDDALIHDVILEDGGQQFMKASPGSGFVDDVTVSCSQFVMSADGRDNVWGYGSQNGNTRCYTGGIDTHDARRWHVHDSYFQGIYCNGDGPQRPVHGRAPDARNGMTYTGGLSEHAIHMWDAESGGGHIIERNTIVDCARGIGLGFNAETYDSVIVNNTVSSRFENTPEHDVGISVMRAHDTQVAHNTVIYTSPSAYPDAIEYRYGSTSNLSVVNNLTNQNVRARDGANADTQSNVTDADPSWFVDADGGNLHLGSCDLTSVVDAGSAFPSVTGDIDGETRDGASDIGADECMP